MQERREINCLCVLWNKSMEYRKNRRVYFIVLSCFFIAIKFMN